ncbi:MULTISPECIES: hypothetical protein [unclassified Bradyrhizobium]|uniref:hypothetical protein n=1 Tax=unclassified Bradyrhizobium TaxID=2631580 RepID=UPI0028EE0D1F|nr:MULTISPECIES: hypothetical protein [unclassified Bradyrhizobium]
MAQPAAAADRPPDYAELAQEMMALLRQQNLVLASPEKFFAPLVDEITARLTSPRRRAPPSADYETIQRALGRLPSGEIVRTLTEEELRARARAIREERMTVAQRQREQEALIEEELRLARMKAAEISEGGEAEGS